MPKPQCKSPHEEETKHTLIYIYSSSWPKFQLPRPFHVAKPKDVGADTAVESLPDTHYEAADNVQESEAKLQKVTSETKHESWLRIFLSSY